MNSDFKRYGGQRFDFQNHFVCDSFLSRIVMDILPPCKNSKDKNKILHLLSKACPKRCQIRNLKEIVLQYATEDDDVYVFLVEVMKKSLLGCYDHCKVMLDFEGRHIFYLMFFYQMTNKDFFLKWFANGNHQIFIFFCLKEFLCDAIIQMKTVNDFIEEKWKWSVFHEQVVSSMDNSRQILNTIAKREYNLLNRSDWISSVESFLFQVSKQHIKLFRTSNAVTYESKLQVMLNKYIVSTDHNYQFSLQPGKFLWQVMQRSKDMEVIYYALKVLGITDSTIDKLRDQTFQASDFAALTLTQLFSLKEFCRLLHLQRTTSIFVLPQHLYEKQLLALKKKEDHKCNHNHNLGYICFVCNDIKFFLTKISTSSRHSNKLARGSLRVVVDNDIGMGSANSLCFVCGRKPERHVKNSKKKWKDDKKAISRKLFKEKQRNFLSKQCIKTPLKEIDLLGHVMQFNNKMIVLCTSCGNVCMMDSDSFSYSTTLNCKVCHVSKTQTCIKCHMETTCNRILVFNRQRPILHKAPMCNNCTNVYAQQQPVLL